jgi:site-specific recombinase XerD
MFMKDKTHIELDDFNTKIYNNLVPQVDKVFRHCRQGSIKTRYRYRDGMYHFCKFLAMAYRKQNLNSIKPKHLEGYVEQMKESGYTKSYMTTNLSVIRFFIDQKGGDSKKYPTNREMSVDSRTKLDRVGNNKAWSESEFIGFIEFAENVGEYRFADMARVTYSFGLRIHEVARLDHNHLKEALKTGGLSVTGKGGLRRTVMVSNNKALIERLYNNSKVGKKVFIEKDERTHKVINRLQSFINRNQKMFIETDDKCSFHGLRHSFAQNKYQEYLNKGVDDYHARLRTSFQLGHFRVEITDIYLQ